MAKPFGKWIDYVDGVPVTRYTEPVTVQHVKDILPAALALPYEPKVINGVIPDEEERLRGLTYAEVIALRRVFAAADPENDMSRFDAEFVYNYVVGKPKQTQEVISAQVTYQDLLQHYRNEDLANEDLPRLEQEREEQWTVIEIDNRKKEDAELAEEV